MTSTFDVIVVGAGASGLAAARELEESGITSICILEASNRIGGRIKTITPPSDGFIDLGAQWIHGQKGSALYTFAAPLGLIGEKVSVDGEGDFYTDDGDLIDEDLVSEVCTELFNFKSDAMTFKDSEKKPPQSIGHYLRERFDSYLNSLTNRTASEKKIMEAIFHWDMRWERIDNACDSLDQVSAKRWGDFRRCEGHYNMNPKYGMSSIIERFRNTVTKSKIFFGCQVTEINYAEELIETPSKNYKRNNGSSPVFLKCSNGLVFECNHVIVTCSMGFLKKKKNDLFRPPLPPSVDKAIESLGFGVIDKIFLEFEKPFWEPGFTGLHFVWTGNDIPDFNRSKPDTRLQSGERLNANDFWYRAISSFDPAYGHDAVLCGWIGGAEAVYMEKLSDDEVKRTCLFLLRKFTGKDIPEPVRIFRSNWGTDELFFGSYSHRHPSSDSTEEDLIQSLNKPIYAKLDSRKPFPVVVFAGEANSSEYFSTVHGALSNGKSQANYYINFINSNKNSTPWIAPSKL